MTNYQIGDKVRLTATFTDLDNVATNPTAVILRLRSPDGTDTTPTPTNTGAGVYIYDLDLNQSGVWRYRWEGTGTVQAASPDESIKVKSSIFVT